MTTILKFLFINNVYTVVMNEMICHRKSPLVVVLVLLRFHFVQLEECCSSIIPEQIHLSLGNCENEFFLTWITFCATDKSIVWYGTVQEGITTYVEGFVTTFVDSGNAKVVRYVHRVALRNLKSDTYYVYRCGSKYGISATYLFKTNPCGTRWSPRLIIFGDMGLSCSYCLPYIHRDVCSGAIDAVVHIGDIAYNLDAYNGFVGDDFMKLVEPIAARVPYMVAAGNHEQAQNFSHYKFRYTMPGNAENFFYSFNLGPAHFIVISTEVYYITAYGYEPLINQLMWLERDLRIAASPVYRRARPWIIVFGHRPMYCSSDNREDCAMESNVLRFCPSGPYDIGLENLFQRYSVDIAFWGHMHYYERSWPIFNGQVYNGSYHKPYVNAKAPVHIITGAGGMKTGTEKITHIRRDRFPYYSNHYSYTRLLAFNETLLHIEQVSANTEGCILDTFYLIKDLCQ